MELIFLYSTLLLLGIVSSQIFDLSHMQHSLTAVTMVCLAFIMIEVGFGFHINKKKVLSHSWDYLVAATAATFPWIFCFLYFMFFLGQNWQEALLVGRFAAPTSAGILFAMLAAAKLRKTWVYGKAQFLAIFDDLDTILFMIPLQMMIIGFQPKLFWLLVLIFISLLAAYKFLHTLKIPTGRLWLFLYGVIIVILCELLRFAVDISLEVLLPAFMLGCLLHNPEDDQPKDHNCHKHRSPLKPEGKWVHAFDETVKAIFMFLVGCSIPKIHVENIPIGMIVFHIFVLTLLMNFGKCFPMFCYRKEATLKERIALGITMFPRGEVGAGILIISIAYGIGGIAVGIAGLALALNLLFTGFFMLIVTWLIKSTR